VASRALGELAVDIMTGGTLNGTMLTLIIPEFSNLRRMTRDTIALYISKRDV
jgi:hypothetical protein